MKETALTKLIRDRSSIKDGYTDKEVTEEVVLELLEHAKWAPTHGLRQPWRFIFIGQDVKPSFAKKVGATYQAELQENRENYLNEPNAILVAVMDVPEAQKQWDENFGAIASLIQNFSLLGWERKLGVVWKTNPHIYDPKVKDILNVSESEKIVGFIHLGYFDEAPAKKDRISIKEKFETYKE